MKNVCLNDLSGTSSKITLDLVLRMNKTLSLNKNENLDLQSIDRLVQVTASDMGSVNDLILSRADSKVDMVPQIARHLIDAGGKRLRPMLTLVSAKMFSKNTGHQVFYAAAVEFLHNATLLHDDVVDESEMRRGKLAARKIWGNQASVLVGDFLLGQAFMMMVETGDIVALGTLSKAAAIIAEGEVLQLSKASDLSTSDADYMQIIKAKTATLFEAAMCVGAMAGHAGTQELEALSTYGRELGLAFQIADDVLDYGGTKGDLGKNTGDDLREGKMTLPIIIALEAATEEERIFLKSSLGNDTAGEDIFIQVLEIITKYEGLGIAAQRAFTHAAKAREALASFPSSDIKDILGDLADYCVARVT